MVERAKTGAVLLGEVSGRKREESVHLREVYSGNKALFSFLSVFCKEGGSTQIRYANRVGF